MSRKIRCDGESEIFCKIFGEVNKEVETQDNWFHVILILTPFVSATRIFS